jgi:outer membrane protein
VNGRLEHRTMSHLHLSLLPKTRPLLLIAGLVLAAHGSASAQSAGSWLLRLGATQIVPEVTSGDLSRPSTPGSKLDIESDTQVTGGVTYMLSDRFSVDIPLTAGFKHDVIAAGSIAGAGKLGEVQALPATVLLQWRFGAADAALRPYVGLGPTYAHFYKARSTAALSALTGGSPARPTLLELDSKLTVTAQLGVAWRFAPRWALDASVTKTPLKTVGTLSTGQTIEAKLDPMSASVGVAYRF